MSVFSQSGVSLSHVNKLSMATLDQTFEQALELLAGSEWKAGKTYTQDGGYEVATARLAASGGEKLPWHLRDSLHPIDRDLSYEQFRSGLLLVGNIVKAPILGDG